MRNPDQGGDSSGSRLEALLHPLRRRDRILGGAGRLAATGIVLGASVLLLAGLSWGGLLLPGSRPLLRWLPALLGGVGILLTGHRLLRPRPDRALAREAESRTPELEHLPVTLLDLPSGDPLRPRLESRLARVLPAMDPRWVLPGPSRSLFAACGAVGSAGLLVLLLAGGPAQLWVSWGEEGWDGGPEVGLPAGEEVTLQAGSISAPELTLRYRIHPPAYTGLPRREGEVGPEGITALAGSRVTLLGDGLPLRDEEWRIQVVRRGGTTRPLTVTGDGAGWVTPWVLQPEDRGVAVQLDRGSGREAWGRILPLRPILDPAPSVELLEPARDLVLPEARGSVRIRARAEDPFALDSFHLEWLWTRGSGESFHFQEGRLELELREVDGEVDGGRTLEGEGVLHLGSGGLEMGPGDVLHLRALAQDGNQVTGPSRGASATRQIRIVREGEEDQVDAVLSLPVEAEGAPVLTQRMILLLTEELISRRGELNREEFGREAEAIANEQARLRSRLGEEVFSRATGAMEPVVFHLGTGLSPSLVPPTGGGGGQAQGEEGPAHGAEGGASRYGVAAIFSPGVREAEDSPASSEETHDHGHDHGVELEMGAGTDIGSFRTGGGGEMPAGFGELEEPGHLHDGDPILSVNRELLAIHDEMWEAERYLRLAEPAASVPHQERALEGLQGHRESERVFPRGNVRVPPVDVAGFRGTGEVDDAAPAPRSASSLPAGVSTLLSSRLAELLRRLEDRDGAEDGLLTDLQSLALELLVHPELDPEPGAGAAQAATLLQAGDLEGAGEELRRLRSLLDPEPARGKGINPPAPRTTLQASRSPSEDVGREAAGEGRGDGAGADATLSRSSSPFVFATVRYRSGNWDSAPLVPQNLIHALVQYTDLPVAPEGTVVDLESEEIFRYPVLYLTGHLPVRFSEREGRNLERYVERGGFVFMDDHNHDVDGAFHRTATAELARIFGEEALQPLPNDHELYRAFFHFPDGPPTTAHELSGWGDGLIHPELHAVMVDGRIGVLYSNKDYSSEWSYHAVNKRFLAVDNTRFGVNLLIYALTR